VGLGAAVGYLRGLGMAAVAAQEQELTGYALEQLSTVPGLRFIGPDTLQDRGGAISFAVDGIHPHDLGQVLDDRGVAVRVGHHCAWPVCRRYGVPATTRASFHVYTELAEVDLLVAGVRAAQEFFGAAR